MNKNAIKKFAIEARKKLIDSVTDKAGMLGITEKSCSEPITKGVDFEVYQTVAGTEVTLNKRQCEQRRRLVSQIESRGFEAVVEEVAYTWFNRICAIRFMEVNDYLPNRVRVLSSEKEGKMEPDLVTQAPDVDLDLTVQEKEEIINWKMSGTSEDTDKMFGKLFLKQCHQLHDILPGLFEADSDYMELLFGISYTNKDDVIYMLVNPETGIPEADFNVSTLDEEGNPTGQVEIIGWLYQYYNTELKDDIFAKLKKNVKITKERIPAATQLFTPDWIVRYMVENSVGRIWIEHLRAIDPTTDEKATAERFGWKYYLPEAEQEEAVNVKLAEIRTTYKNLKPTDITCIDPCMGSGHILIAMFDVLMDIYESAGYDKREAAFEIVEHNIHGLDIDQRAYQLAYFAVMMKGRGYNRRFLRGRDGKPEPKVYAIVESNKINRNHLKFFGTHLSDMERNLAVMQMDNMVLGIAFGTTVTSIRNCKINKYLGTYHHIGMKDITDDIPNDFPVRDNRYVQISTDKFSKIPGSPVAYWVSDCLLSAFDTGKVLGEYALARNGMKTGDNGRFLRLWWEINNLRLKTDCTSYLDAVNSKAKWFPYNKGGEYRKWYGNNDYVVNWENGGDQIFNHAKQDGRNVQDYPAELKFAPSLSWSLITSGTPAFRYKQGNLSDIAGMSVYASRDLVLRYLALLNSPIALETLKLITPTINYQAGDIARIPVLPEVNSNQDIIPLVEENISLVKEDWDASEISWNFESHPLIKSAAFSREEMAQERKQHIVDMNYIEEAFNRWDNECYIRSNQLKTNEEELNRIFIDIYGLQDELTPEVRDKDVTVRKADLQRDIRSFISYAVGCMFGRYSLDVDGLAYAGGEWDSSRYLTFRPDDDNCIPITDEDYFSDDIVRRLVEFVKTVYGADTLEENLDFIANALGNKGDTSREVIRNYFLKDFYADHLKVYQKRPIYWLFDSGKQNGFKALIYMHRYDADTVGRVRTDYLHRAQKYVETAMQSAQYTIDNATSASEKSKATKAVTKYTKQLAEMQIYDEAIAHIANKRIRIDLDDGVKVNYEKFQGVEVAQEGKKALKVDLLAKLK